MLDSKINSLSLPLSLTPSLSLVAPKRRRSEDPKLIIRAITFELVQPICPRYINVTEQTDGRTDVGLTTAIPR